MLCPGEIPSSVRDGRSERLFDDRVLSSGPWTIEEFEALLDATTALAALPRSHVRGAVDRCRESKESGDTAFADLLENLERGIGNRGGRRMKPRDLTHHFGASSFFHLPKTDAEGVTQHVTRLLDCVDLFRFVVSDDAAQVEGQMAANEGGAR